jgi:hypothetical protein
MGIIELNGKQYKEHYVVMLDSYSKQSTLFLKGELLKLEYNEKPPLHGIRDLGWKYQFLYIMSKDKIKQGDLFFSTSHNKVFKCVNEDDLEHYDGDLYKIIATNNVDINEPTQQVAKYTTYAVLPKPSVRFLEYFVEKFNTFNLVTKVLVEYMCNECDCYYTKNCKSTQLEGGVFCQEDKNKMYNLLKVNINNEIIIDIPNIEIQRGYAQFYPNGEECTFSSNAASQICDIIVNNKTKELREELLNLKEDLVDKTNQIYRLVNYLKQISEGEDSNSNKVDKEFAKDCLNAYKEYLDFKHLKHETE